MARRKLGSTGLEIAPLVFGGNVFGWTIDERTSFDVLDAFVDHGFNAIDTADVYSVWAPGNQGGESETIIGRWLRARPGARDKVVLCTKVGSDMRQPGEKGLSACWIEASIEASLTRLGVDSIDLYFSHKPDAGVAHEETLGAYERLLKAGKIKSIGASNFSAEQLTAARAAAETHGLPVYQVLQPEYNLYDRDSYEGALRDFAIREGLGVVPYYALASGFLSGKYRTTDDTAQSKRGEKIAARYMNPRGVAILAALDQVCERHGAQPAEVSLAWMMQREGVTAPIASATSVAQIESFARAAALRLDAADLAVLDGAGA